MSTIKRRRSKNVQPPIPKRPTWMLPAVLVGIGAAIIALALWLIQGSQQPPYTAEVSGQPSAAIDQAFFDYGDVRMNTPVETVFRVKNIGDQPLTLLGEPRVELVEGC
ncbi:MAG: hypothetical protein HZC41_21525 [Chloroflexi bacterium]|nr:hypothetical protein [Chloroflexota bacterium]